MTGTTSPGTSVPANSARPEPVISVSQNRAVTTSMAVAEFFGKPHNDVLKSIRALLAYVPADHQRNFSQTVAERPNPSGGGSISSPAFLLTRDGFTLLAMGFTGKRALHFKLAYIDAFNQMEARLQQRAVLAPALDPKLTARVDERAWELARTAFAWYRGEMLADQDVKSGTLRPEHWTPTRTEHQSLQALARHAAAFEVVERLAQSGRMHVMQEGRRLAAYVGLDWDADIMKKPTAKRGG
ncbi:Rha family transcriptional regulator [Achromobacter sp. GG226]|uniref:Rha family transcriptional regulator n=1 Tax=Verticiella alkaliphila TaxID=2779529 RepID=UPI001C0AE6B2|nr:Rha family transcriptional regulator [Verticiella sp. GG226]MBU4610297.1 Rha family transcriptional regulator [Verticiella sp. GG226]